jgi:hypothetical protein
MKGTVPSVGDGIVHRESCTTLSLKSASCCDLTMDMQIKNCGSFYVYYLKPTPYCPSGYCAGKYLKIWKMSSFLYQGTFILDQYKY